MLPYLCMLVGSLAFAVMSSLASSLGPHCDWQVIALFRTSLACLFAAILARTAGAELVFFRPPVLWMRSIAGSISLVCGFYALTRLDLSNVVTLANMYPIWVAVLSWPLLGEIPSRDVWVAVAAGVAGVFVLEQPHLNHDVSQQIATLVAILSSFTSGVALIGLHRLHGIDPRSVVVHFSAVAFLFCLAALWVFPVRHGWTPLAEPLVLGKLLGLGAAATCGQLLLTIAFASGQPAKVAVVGLSQVGFGMLLELVFWGRHFTPVQLAGIALVVAPTAWVMTRRSPPPAQAKAR